MAKPKPPYEPGPSMWLHGKQAEKFQDAKVGTTLNMNVKVRVTGTGKHESKYPGERKTVRHNADLEVLSMKPAKPMSSASSSTPAAKSRFAPTKTAAARPATASTTKATSKPTPPKAAKPQVKTSNRPGVPKKGK